MINAILNGFFNLVLYLFNLILSPVISAITVLFPDLTNLFSYFTQFLTQAVSYVPLMLRLLFIPQQAVVLLFDYFIILYSIHLLTLTIKFAINIYNKFKP